ncbi:VOC family protein [Anditalea andensis]|uniref:Lactoylglutathione lyase n=1 Tax=Anditalea andensis TaxID=1048983 RepID=A0A074KQK1_9BACT|nr:VOC family protein [Anditalea andensis]KEO72221.1 lactoylglutathione lyase [Anditalea andensis]
MKKFNPVVWFEIYVNDLNRAALFYEAVLQVSLNDMTDPSDETIQMKGFPSDMEDYGASGALVKMDEVKPSANGSIVYFGCDDCKELEDRVKDNGGKIIKSKMSIGEHGFVSLLMDTEGNSIGFHSMK